jgi:pentatricopeptide repeat protein
MWCIREWARAQAVLISMVQIGHHPDAVTYNTLIYTMGRLGQWRRADAILKNMHSTDHRPTAVTFGSCTHSCLSLTTSTTSIHPSLSTWSTIGKHPSLLQVSQLVYNHLSSQDPHLVNIPPSHKFHNWYSPIPLTSSTTSIHPSLTQVPQLVFTHPSPRGPQPIYTLPTHRFYNYYTAIPLTRSTSSVLHTLCFIHQHLAFFT